MLLQWLILGLLKAVKSQNLVLVGGNLADDNADIYNKIVDLAVSIK